MAAFALSGMLAACNAPETPDSVARALIPSLGLSRLRYAAAVPEVEAVVVTGLSGQAHGKLVWSSASARISRPRREPGGWEADAIALSRTTLAPPDEPDRPRAFADSLSFERPRADAPVAAWRSADATGVSFLDGDAGTRLSAGKVEMSLNTVGTSGEIMVRLSAQGVAPRPSWLAGLGATPCVLAAFASAGPLLVTATLRYRPTERMLALEDVSLSGRTGTLLVSLVLDNVGADKAGMSGLVAALADWESIPSDVNLRSARIDFRNGGAVPACLSAYPDLKRTGPAGLSDAVLALPFLSDESDRAPLSSEILAYLAKPNSLSLTLSPTDELPVRTLGGTLASTARGRYMSLVLTVNGRPPIVSGTPAATIPMPSDTETTR